MKRYKWVGVAFVLCSLIGFLIFFGVPFLISFVLSFSRTSGKFNFNGFQNYIALFKTNSFLLALTNTLKFILIGVPLLMLFAILMALAFNSLNALSWKGIGVLFSLSLIPMLIPSSTIVLFVQVLFERYGVVNGVIVRFGGQPIEWMNTEYTIFILLGLYIWKNFSYIMVIVLGAIKGIDKGVYEAASLDGAVGIRRFWYITLPLIRQFLFFSLLLSVMGIFKMFRESYLLFGDYPHESVYMLQNFMNNNFYSINYQKLSAASTLFFLVISILILTVILRKKNSEQE